MTKKKVARIIVGANGGDEGKGTVVARYTKESTNVLNILTNGGSQRGHSILTKDGNITYHHFGAGTYYGADNYYSHYFMLNPVQFTKEHQELIVKPNKVYRSDGCRWTTIYDMMANHISEEQRKRHASCRMGIWFTLVRYENSTTMSFDRFMALPKEQQLEYLKDIKAYYERKLEIPDGWKDTWNNPYLAEHFIQDCKYMYDHTIVATPWDLTSYDNFIFENGQGLLLKDTGVDTYDTTPSDTGCRNAFHVLRMMGVRAIPTVHYVTRPYLTRHGDGPLMGEKDPFCISSDIKEDRTNHYNEAQGEFRYGILNISKLVQRVSDDWIFHTCKPELELTHCDEMDRVKEFKEAFSVVHTYDSPNV